MRYSTFALAAVLALSLGAASLATAGERAPARGYPSDGVVRTADGYGIVPIDDRHRGHGRHGYHRDRGYGRHGRHHHGYRYYNPRAYGYRQHYGPAPLLGYYYGHSYPAYRRGYYGSRCD